MHIFTFIHVVALVKLGLGASLQVLGAGAVEKGVIPSVVTITGLSAAESAAFFARRGSSSLKGTAAGTQTVIEPEGAGWGDYRDWQYCPDSSWAIGYSQRIESDQGSNRDDTAMNSIELVCGDVSGNIMGKIRSYDGIWGTWGIPVFCDGAGNFMRTVQFKVEAGQERGDDTAADDSRFECTNGRLIQATNGAQWGTWRSTASCPLGSALCGFQIRYEDDQHDGDDTAMNGARFLCCSI